MRGKKAVFLILILLATVLQLPLAISDPGWLADWDYRVKITIDSGDVDEALTDFPVLIYISDSSGIYGENISFIFDEVGANSLKIAVTLSDGLTECYVEIEKWDLGNREAWLWVKVPTISNLTDTDLYLYYDNDHTDNTNKVGPTNSAQAENVWDTDFLMVQHQAGAASPIRDSTSNDIDMTETGDPTYQQAGEIDGEINYDGSDDHYSAVDVFDDIVGTDKGTIGLWVKSTTSGTSVRFIFTIEGAYSLIYFDDDDGEIRAFWAGSAADYAKSTTVCNTGAQFYVVTTYDGANQRIYVNGVLEDTDLCNLYDITGINRVSRIAAQHDGSLKLSAIIDEIQVSKIDRSVSWIESSYETGRDNFLDFGSEEEKPVLESPTYLFGAGFNASSPYVSLYWKSNLTGITLFEVQNSTAKISWDYLGSNTTREYHDFQVVNGTERYYRVRACNFTDGAWLNSTFSDINFETVYFISEIGEVSCKIRNYNASSITVIAGVLNDGNLASTFSVDGDWYNVSEINDIPGLDVRFNFTNIGGDPNCGCLDVYHSYTGHPQHDIKIQVWNFTSTSWYQIGTLIYNETAGWECSGLGNYAEHFFHNGSFWGRFYHESQGHVVHEMQIDQIRLDVIYGEECPPCEDVTALLAMGKYYALAIILLILGLLIGIGMRRRR